MKPTALAGLLLAWLALPACTPDDPLERTPVDAARDFLAAVDAQDYDRAWSMTTDAYREPWARLTEEARKDPGTRRPVEQEYLSDEIQDRIARGELPATTPREVFRLELGHRHDAARPWLPPEDMPFESGIDADAALVLWQEANLAIRLRRADGAWRVEQVRASIDLVRKTIWPGIALPRLPRDRRLPLHNEAVWLSIAADGALAIRQRTLTLEQVGEWLTTRGQVFMRLEDSGSTEVTLVLGPDRAAAWTHIEAVLRLATGSEVRYHDLEIVTRIGNRFEHGVPVRLRGPSDEGTDPGSPIVEVGHALRPADLADIRAALEALPGERLRAGVRARLAPDLRSEDGFRALLAMAAAGASRVIVERPEIGRLPAEGIHLDGKAVVSRSSLRPAPGEPGLLLVLR